MKRRSGDHNDAVVQGLSEIPYMQDVAHWGVLTIGTGLGNARFTNRNRRREVRMTISSAARPPAIPQRIGFPGHCENVRAPDT